MQTMNTPSRHDEQVLIELARGGDENAYRELIETHRSELHAHCYRMLASADDADDAVQDALLRAWRGLANFESRSSIRTWLFKIATNAALDVSQRRSRRALPVSFGTSAKRGEQVGEEVYEISWLGPYPTRLEDTPSTRATPDVRYELRESLELAFIEALQLLPANQRAVLLFRDVLGHSAIETAELLDTSVPAVNSSLQRARATIDPQIPRASQRATLSALGPEGLRTLAAKYCDAIETGDTAALLSLLTEDATWSMPPVATWFQGRAGIGEFYERDVAPGRWAHLTTSANGQLAIAGYVYDDERHCFAAEVIDVVTLEGDLISSVVGFVTTKRPGFEVERLFPRFGLPLELPG
jgi:RNA polymerase sigma-70 factor (ECF subfamily)